MIISNYDMIDRENNRKVTGIKGTNGVNKKRRKRIISVSQKKWSIDARFWLLSVLSSIII